MATDTTISPSSEDIEPAVRSLPVRLPTFVIRPTSGWAALNYRELWDYRDLLLILVQRELKLRYRQTALGLFWVIIQPVLAAGIFSIIFGHFIRLPSGTMPYLLFNFAGLVGWNYLSGGLQRAAGSLISNSQLISKVYFPRLIIPVAHVLAVLVDFAVLLVVLLMLMAFYQVPPTWHLATLPLFLVMGTIISVGASLWVSALSVRYRDFLFAVPFLTQVLMYASPILYRVETIPPEWRSLYALNPMVGFIEGFRWSTLGEGALNSNMLVSSTAASLLLFLSGVYFFRRVERGFADVI